MEYREDLMAKAPSVRKNYIYNLIYQVMTLITPFITTPYISRVLGADGTGVQSYTNSVVQYFAILAALGTASYGQREIARHRDEIKIRSRLFWEIEVLCMATTAACLIIWLFVIGFAREYRPYYVVLTMTLLAVAFDISWFLGAGAVFPDRFAKYGSEACGHCHAVFIYPGKEDLLLYVALTAATGLLGNISMWGYLKGQVEKPVLKELRPLRHLKETLVYFIPTIATSVYTILDKTMLGWFSGENKSQNGYYEYATGFVNMAKILIMSFNAVMSARMSYLFGTGRMEEIHKRFQDSLDFVLLMAMPIMLGLAGIAAQFIPWFLGNGYLPVTFLMYVCSPLVLVVGLSDCIGSQILTPGGKRAQSGKVIVAGAMVNACLNFLLIPHFAALGAAAASVAAECFITSLYLWLGRDFIKLKMLVRYGWRRLVAAVIMLGAVVWTGQFLEQVRGLGPITTFIQIGAGAMVYFLVLLVMRDPFLYQYLGKIYRRLTGQP